MSANISDAFITRIKSSTQVISREAKQARTLHRVLITLALVTGTIATALAGIAAANNEAIITDWPTTCWIVAVFTGTASLCTGLIQQFSLSTRVANAEACLGRLHAIDIALSLGKRETEPLLDEYQEIIKDYPACFMNVEV